jgi:hypothetical protein
MKKQLIKEIFDLNKVLKNEQKKNQDNNNELNHLEQEIKPIEDKINNIIEKKNENDKIPKLSTLDKLYETSMKKNREKIFIEYNLSQFQKENDNKEAKLQKYFKDFLDKETKNDELIEKKTNELLDEYDKVQRYFPDEKKQEQYVISPETMSIHMFSKITTEIDFMNLIRKQTKNTKIKNDKIQREIDLYLKKLYTLRSKKDSSLAEMSTAAAKNSSHLEKKNYIFQQFENINNNTNCNLNNEDSISSISMELETNLDLDNLPSNDESLRFIDRVFDIKSNIKPIKNKLKTDYFPPTASKEKTRKAEPIKIERPVDYKTKGENLEKEINEIKNEIEKKKKKMEDLKEKRKKIEEDNINKEDNLKHAYMKIKIIKDQIDFIKKQIEDFNKNKENGEYYKIYSINNIINNRNYYLYNINNANNNISDLETFRK